MRAGPERSGEFAALALSWHLQGVLDRAEFLRAAAEMLLRLVRADVVGWNAIGPASGVELVMFPGEEWDVPRLTADLAEIAGEHPMVRSYLAEPATVRPAPRRLSDIASRQELLANRAYVEHLRPIGAEHQLAVLTSRPGPDTVRGWALNRESHDFTDDEVELTGAVQSMLGLLDRAMQRPAATAEIPAAERLGLTAREVEVLGHIGAGLTAEAAARLLRISMRTVRKHLENAYRKLDCHDRLLAVQRAQELGIIPGRPVLR